MGIGIGGRLGCGGVGIGIGGKLGCGGVAIGIGGIGNEGGEHAIMQKKNIGHTNIKE